MKYFSPHALLEFLLNGPLGPLLMLLVLLGLTLPWLRLLLGDVFGRDPAQPLNVWLDPVLPGTLVLVGPVTLVWLTGQAWAWVWSGLVLVPLLSYWANALRHWPPVVGPRPWRQARWLLSLVQALIFPTFFLGLLFWCRGQRILQGLNLWDYWPGWDCCLDYGPLALSLTRFWFYGLVLLLAWLGLWRKYLLDLTLVPLYDLHLYGLAQQAYSQRLRRIFRWSNHLLDYLHWDRLRVRNIDKGPLRRLLCWLAAPGGHLWFCILPPLPLEAWFQSGRLRYFFLAVLLLSLWLLLRDLLINLALSTGGSTL